MNQKRLDFLGKFHIKPLGSKAKFISAKQIGIGKMEVVFLSNGEEEKQIVAIPIDENKNMFFDYESNSGQKVIRIYND